MPGRSARDGHSCDPSGNGLPWRREGLVQSRPPRIGSALPVGSQRRQGVARRIKAQLAGKGLAGLGVSALIPWSSAELIVVFRHGRSPCSFAVAGASTAHLTYSDRARQRGGAPGTAALGGEQDLVRKPGAGHIRPARVGSCRWRARVGVGDSTALRDPMPFDWRAGTWTAPFTRVNELLAPMGCAA